MSLLKNIAKSPLPVSTCRQLAFTYSGALRSQSTDASGQSNNDPVNPDFINRNPRNLEQMGLAIKEAGWRFHYPSKRFFHQLQFETTSKHTFAHVKHCTNDIVVSASTKELAIAKHLYSNTDISAAENIGRVLARRCLECGVTTMSLHDSMHGNSQRFNKFVEAMKESGIELEEPDTYVPDYEPGIDYDNEEEVQNLHERQIMAGTRGPTSEYFYQLRKRQRLGKKRPIKVQAPPMQRPSE